MPKNAKKKVKDAKEQKHFFKDVRAELKKVIWPTPKQLLNNTAAVIVIVIMVGIIVFVLDVCFEKINALGVEGLKAIVQEQTNSVEIDNSISNEISNEVSNEVSNPTENTATVEDQNTVSNETADNTNTNAENN